MSSIPTARAAILEDLKARFLAGDKMVLPVDRSNMNRWGKQANYFAGAGEIDCPVCKAGKLRYSRASSNGHVHAACTSGCVAWME